VVGQVYDWKTRPSMVEDFSCFEKAASKRPPGAKAAVTGSAQTENPSPTEYRPTQS
jgi:hypothetical protein